ncbi:MAG: 30S ribosomal protein S13 [Spirochaetia bacterium]|nr:30S ribosomal protein S13 [Spirochaetia bacterium]
MARIAGVDLPSNKRIEIALTYIYGIGRSRSRTILKSSKIDLNRRVQDLKESEIGDLKAIIEQKYTIEGDLRSQVTMHIKRLMDIGCYRGIRHRRGLPVRGQNTKTNAKTRKKRKGGAAQKGVK